MKRIVFLIIMLLLLPLIVKANFAVFRAEKVNVKVENIDENIKDIWLVTYTDKASIEDAYKDSDLDFTNASYLDTKIDGNNVNYCAIFKDEVEPFTKEDEYVYNDNYDKENYFIKNEKSYEYDLPNGNGFGDGIKGKYTDPEELIKDGFEYENEKTKNAIRRGEITCTRSIFYCANKLNEVEQIPVSNIKDGVLNLTLSDFSKIEKYEMTGYALRFEKENGEYVSIVIGDNGIFVDSIDKDKYDSNNMIKNIVIDYNKKSIVSFSDDKEEHRIYTENVNNGYLLIVIIAIIVTLVTEIIIALIMKIKSIKVIAIVNIVTQLLLHAYTFFIIPLISGLSYLTLILIAEVIIVLLEFLIYKKLINIVSSKKLFLYSLIANAVSFGISYIVSIIG